MKVVAEYPPNIDKLDPVFHCKDKPVIYAYGDTIYNPHRIYIPNHLMGHEAVHIARQMQGGADAWWDKYIADDEFRYAEELVAHRMELAIQFDQVRDRNARAKLTMATAARLVAPLYAYKRSLLQAQKDLQA
jgi:hypothetical protein